MKKYTLLALIATIALLSGCASKTPIADIYEDTPYGDRIAVLEKEYKKTLEERRAHKMMSVFEKSIHRMHMGMVEDYEDWDK